MIALCALSLCAACRPSAPETGEDASQRWRVHAARAHDLWFEARALSEQQGHGPVEGPLGSLVSALRSFRATVGAPLVGSLDARVLAAGDAEAVRVAFRELPDTWSAPGSAALPLRGPALELADLLVMAAPAWAEEQAGALRAKSEVRWEELAAALRGNGFERSLRRAAAALDLPWPEDYTPAFVHVLRAPRPGAFTARTRSGPISLIATQGLQPGELLEVVLHEALHQLEARASAPGVGLPSALDSALATAGLGPRDRRRKVAAHALLFYASAEAVRAGFDGAHVDHGLRAGTYERFPDFHPELLNLFRERFFSEMSEEAFLSAAVQLVLATD